MASRRDESPVLYATRLCRGLLLLLLAGNLAVAGSLAFAHRRQLLATCLEVLRAIASLGPLRGTLVLCCLQSIGFVLLIPTSFLSVTAGCAFGLGAGLAAASAGYLCGCLLPFYLSRCVFSSMVTRWIRRYPLATGVMAAVEEQPFLLVALLRLSPAIPGPVNCYLLGLTRVRVRTYLAATAVGAAPNCAFCVYLGSLMHTFAEVLDGSAPAPPWPFLVIGLVATLLALGFISRMARRKVAEKSAVTAEHEHRPVGGCAGPLDAPVVLDTARDGLDVSFCMASPDDSPSLSRGMRSPPGKALQLFAAPAKARLRTDRGD
eukprot:scaffold14246_cov105-Isochrysis_galbana.AAC.14